MNFAQLLNQNNLFFDYGFKAPDLALFPFPEFSFNTLDIAFDPHSPNPVFLDSNPGYNPSGSTFGVGEGNDSSGSGGAGGLAAPFTFTAAPETPTSLNWQILHMWDAHGVFHLLAYSLSSSSDPLAQTFALFRANNNNTFQHVPITNIEKFGGLGSHLGTFLNQKDNAFLTVHSEGDDVVFSMICFTDIFGTREACIFFIRISSTGSYSLDWLTESMLNQQDSRTQSGNWSTFVCLVTTSVGNTNIPASGLRSGLGSIPFSEQPTLFQTQQGRPHYIFSQLAVGVYPYTDRPEYPTNFRLRNFNSSLASANETIDGVLHRTFYSGQDLEPFVKFDLNGLFNSNLWVRGRDATGGVLSADGSHLMSFAGQARNEQGAARQIRGFFHRPSLNETWRVGFIVDTADFATGDAGTNIFTFAPRAVSNSRGDIINNSRSGASGFNFLVAGSTFPIRINNQLDTLVGRTFNQQTRFTSSSYGFACMESNTGELFSSSADHNLIIFKPIA